MAVKGNNSAEKIGAAPKTLYSGLADSKIVMVNPTKEELAKYGVNFETEPTYITDKDGVANLRLDFWVQPQVSEDILTKGSLWLSNENYVGQTSGKTQFINSYGRTGWGMSKDECGQYFQTAGAREALKGEEDLHKLLAEFLNTKYNDKTNEFDECLLDNPKALFTGNYSELKSIFNSYKDNTVRLMYGVEVKEDKAYQKVYMKHFERTWTKPNYTKWNNALTGQYSQFKADYQDSFEFQVFDVKPNSPKADAEKTSDADVF